MRIHLTCSQPNRSHVLAVHAAAEMLRPAGNTVTSSWPETWQDEDGERRLGLNRRAINEADVIVHVCDDDEVELPVELTAALRFGTPVVRYEPEARHGVIVAGEATAAVTRLEDLSRVVTEVFTSTVG